MLYKIPLIHNIEKRRYVFPDPRTRIRIAALGALPVLPSFADIQQALAQQSLELFGVVIDFTQTADFAAATSYSDKLYSANRDKIRYNLKGRTNRRNVIC